MFQGKNELRFKTGSGKSQKAESQAGQKRDARFHHRHILPIASGAARWLSSKTPIRETTGEIGVRV